MQRLGEYRDNLINWLKQRKNNLLLGLSYLVIGVLCFEAGWLQKSLVTSEAIQVTVATAVSPGDNLLKEVSQTVPTKTDSSAPVESCQFVGSKKSNKYHHPLSRCAKQIKPENRVCFVSSEAAQAKKYIPGCIEP